MTFLQKLATSLAGLNPSCRESVRLMAQSRHAPASLGRRTGLRIHLMLCGFCRQYRSQVDQLTRLPHLDLQDQSLPTPARQKFKAALAHAAMEEQHQRHHHDPDNACP